MSFKVAQLGISALPLHAISAVVLDSETTGLDTTSDRMIELAAVRIADGQITDDVFEKFVKPDIPIPPRSTEIHSITDADVADAAEFGSVMADFANWAEHDVVIGYSIGFDLAIMSAEHQRGEIHWTPPRTIDVRHLIKICAPNLPQDSLEVAAEWLGVHITGRHRALGDAQATADIFLALIPKLRKNGINTLAQAERACSRLASRLTEETQAGWHDVAARGREGPRSVHEYARIDSYAYRHLVSDVMHSPPQTVPADVSLKDALHKMASLKISSVFVMPPAGGGDIGILTERDVLRAVDDRGAVALDAPVTNFSVGPLVTIPGSEFVYRAITLMSRRNFRHLGVVDDEGQLAGALSARDLLKQRAGDAMSLGETIDAATTPAELGRVWADLTMVVRGLVYEEVDSRDIAAIISRELRALTRSACRLAELQLAEEGRGPAPVPYAMLVLGSGGRGESLLAMDQDNAVIYADDAPDGADDWFKRLGEIVADTLNDAGVIYCPGGIMAKNDAWRMSESKWRDTVAHWIGHARPEDLLNSDIFFDAMPVFGDYDMGENLRTAAMAAAKDAADFIKVMTAKASEFSSPIGMFGRIKSDDGRVDLKLHGIMPIFSAARVLALRHGVAPRSTPARLEAVKEKDIPGAKFIDRVLDAHRILLNAILRQQLRDLETGVPLSNKVALADLAAHENQELKWALEQCSVITDLMGAPARL